MSNKHRDYIPRNPAEFNTFLANITTYVNSKLTAWGHIPSERFTELITVRGLFQSANQATVGPHTPVQTLARRQAQAQATRVLREFVNQYLRFPPVTDEDRLAMGIPNRDTIRTPSAAPVEVPEIVVNTDVLRRLRLRARSFGSRNWGKPAGVRDIEFKWAILDARPGHINDLVNTENVTANPLDLFFEEEDRGKRVYFSARWVAGKDKEGPWSDIESAFVP